MHKKIKSINEIIKEYKVYYYYVSWARRVKENASQLLPINAQQYYRNAVCNKKINKTINDTPRITRKTRRGDR